MGKGEIMDEDDYMNWYQNNFDENAVMFAEKNEEEFEEFCYERYIQAPDDDDVYERMKDYKEDFTENKEV